MDEERQRFDAWVERYGDTRPEFTAAGWYCWCAWLAAKADAKAQAEEAEAAEMEAVLAELARMGQGLGI